MRRLSAAARVAAIVGTSSADEGAVDAPFSREVRLDARPRPVGIRVRVQKVVDEVGNPVGDEAQQKRRHDHHDLLDDRQALPGL